MSPFAQVCELYEPETLGHILSMCANVGVVHADSDCFFCAYPVIRRNLNSVIEIESKKDIDKSDTWFIHIASGDIKKAFKHIPEKKYIAFERFDDRERVYDFDRLRRLIWET